MTELRAKTFAQALANAYRDHDYFELSLDSRDDLVLVAHALQLEFGYAVIWHPDLSQIGVDKFHRFQCGSMESEGTSVNSEIWMTTDGP
jgi:hypothetical protein